MTGDEAMTDQHRSDRYHHGNLPVSLVAAGRDLIEESGLSALSLRAVARRAGVSHAAPAHHFASLGLFLSACAASGFADFSESLLSARARATAPASALAEMGRAYLAFAARHPAMFRLMFNHDAIGERTPEHVEQGGRAYQTLVDAVRALDERVDEPTLEFRTLAIWSLAHGYADLMLERQVGPGCDIADQVLPLAQGQVARALLALIRGFDESS
jgi:AcrR family transcriptional regulator